VVTLPSGTTAGDLVIVAFAEVGTSAVTWPAGWTDLHSGNDASSTTRVEVRQRVASGALGASITITTASAVNTAHYAWRIAASNTTTAPEAVGTSGFSVSADAPSLNPTGWGAEDTLWLALMVTNTQPSSITGFPASYANTATSGVSGQVVSLGVGERLLNAVSEDPGTFTLSGASNWRAVTIGVRPTAGAQIAEKTFSILIVPVLSFATPTLLDGKQGKPYSYTFAATGGVLPYTYVSTGTLPSGLSLSSTGVLSGTPTAVGSYSFGVTVTDANSVQASITAALVIGAQRVRTGRSLALRGNTIRSAD
jgi:hypothetical protein